MILLIKIKLLNCRERLNEIQENKEFYGNDYRDHGLLICKPDGRPIDPKDFSKWFKKWQASQGIKEQIEFQGLRKSGQMHKVRLTKNNYQLVAENSGQSPEVLMSNYNEALDSEKRTLSLLVETNFYPQSVAGEIEPEKQFDIDNTMQQIQENPEFAKQILQLLLSNAANVTQ